MLPGTLLDVSKEFLQKLFQGFLQNTFRILPEVPTRINLEIHLNIFSRASSHNLSMDCSIIVSKNWYRSSCREFYTNSPMSFFQVFFIKFPRKFSSKFIENLQKTPLENSEKKSLTNSERNILKSDWMKPCRHSSRNP